MAVSGSGETRIRVAMVPMYVCTHVYPCSCSIAGVFRVIDLILAALLSNATSAAKNLFLMPDIERNVYITPIVHRLIISDHYSCFAMLTK